MSALLQGLDSNGFMSDGLTGIWGSSARPRFPAGLLSHCSGRLSLQTTTAQYPVSKKPLVLLFGFAPISSKNVMLLKFIGMHFERVNFYHLYHGPIYRLQFFVNSSHFKFWKLWPTSGISKQILSKMRRSLYKNEDLLAVQCKSTSRKEAEKTNP